jgi:2,3-bisphosphoglycerate-independent phosphoglycerate mutase
VEKAYNALVNGAGTLTSDAFGSIQQSYDAGITDEFIEPASANIDGASRGIQNEDSVIFFNFRADRARQLTSALAAKDFVHFDRHEDVNIRMTTMTRYDEGFNFAHVAFAPGTLVNTLGEYVSSLGLSQLRIAETEKYAHVTYFFSGGDESAFPGEKRILVPSPKVATYDTSPEMSAGEVTRLAILEMKTASEDLIVLNFANCDMVGHTGVMEAARKAVSWVDSRVRILSEAALEAGYAVLITADHGNAELMTDDAGTPHTAHTTNLVPIVMLGAPGVVSLSNGALSDVAPTVLDAMELAAPEEMQGHSLINRREI